MRAQIFLSFFLVLCGCGQDDPVPPAPSPSGGGGSELTAPQLSTPSNNATGLWTPLYYSWSTVSGADAYEVHAWYYQSGSNSQYTFVSHAGLTGPSYAQTTPLGENGGWHGKVIYWQARATSGTGSALVHGPWSTTWSFTLQ